MTKEKTMANKRIWLGILAIVFATTIGAVGCDNDPADDNGNENENNNNNNNNNNGNNNNGNSVIGTTGPGGGKIIYYSAEGFTMTDTGEICHYLEAAPADMSATLAWASSGYTSTNIAGTGTAIGAGRKNTALIRAMDANAPAAKACKEYSGGSKTDWFLPSKDELNQLYKNKTSVSGIGTGYYWSSSQYDDKRTWAQTLSDGWQDYGDRQKTKNHSVRAVRAY